MSSEMIGNKSSALTWRSNGLGTAAEMSLWAQWVHVALRPDEPTYTVILAIVVK